MKKSTKNKIMILLISVLVLSGCMPQGDTYQKVCEHYGHKEYTDTGKGDEIFVECDGGYLYKRIAHGTTDKWGNRAGLDYYWYPKDEIRYYKQGYKEEK